MAKKYAFTTDLDLIDDLINMQSWIQPGQIEIHQLDSEVYQIWVWESQLLENKNVVREGGSEKNPSFDPFYTIREKLDLIKSQLELISETEEVSVHQCGLIKVKEIWDGGDARFEFVDGTDYYVFEGGYYPSIEEAIYFHFNPEECPV